MTKHSNTGPKNSLSAPTQANRLARVAARLQGLPKPIRVWLTSRLLGRLVPFVGTAGVRVEHLSAQTVVVSIANRRAVQNHIQGVHAVAAALLAETASGFCVGLNVPDSRLPLLKRMQLDYTRRAQGGLRVTASLRPEQMAQIRELERGEVEVSVSVTDARGQSPMQGSLTWAWVPKVRKDKAGD